MGCICSKDTKQYTEETNDEVKTDNSDTTVTAIAESQLSNDEAVTTPLDPQAPIAATSNPLVTSSLTQAEQNQPPERRETVTSRSGIPTVGDDEEESVMIGPTAARTPTLLTTVTSSFTLIRLPSVNVDATGNKVEEPMDKPQGTTLPNEVKNKERPIHESPLTEYTEPTEATQANSEKDLVHVASSSDTPPMEYPAGAEETKRLEDVECRDGDHDFVVMSLKNRRQN